MDLHEFKQAFQMGVNIGTDEVPDPGLFGCDSSEEALAELADVTADPLRRDTHIYEIRGSHTRLVGINARSKSDILMDDG